MRILTYACRTAITKQDHEYCTSLICSCPHHKPAPPDPIIEEPIMTTGAEIIETTAGLLKDRLRQIDEQLEGYDALREERKVIESALKALRPDTKKVGTTTHRATALPRSESGKRLRDYLLDAFSNHPNRPWTAVELVTELRNAGWTSVGDAQAVVSTMCSSLAGEGRIERVERGVYRAGSA